MEYIYKCTLTSHESIWTNGSEGNNFTNINKILTHSNSIITAHAGRDTDMKQFAAAFQIDVAFVISSIISCHQGI
jgi:hypothetical protein